MFRLLFMIPGVSAACFVSLTFLVAKIMYENQYHQPFPFDITGPMLLPFILLFIFYEFVFIGLRIIWHKINRHS
jgi:hypothetical protein